MQTPKVCNRLYRNGTTLLVLHTNFGSLRCRTVVVPKQKMLSIPEYATIIDLPTSRIWREESGIICAISKKTKPQTLEQARESINSFRNQVGEGKVCMLIDVTYSSESSREVRAFAAEELPKIVKAIAMVSESALGRMVANLFFNLKSQPYPVKMFNDEWEARTWLKKYL